MRKEKIEGAVPIFRINLKGVIYRTYYKFREELEAYDYELRAPVSYLYCEMWAVPGHIDEDFLRRYNGYTI